MNQQQTVTLKGFTKAERYTIKARLELNPDYERVARDCEAAGREKALYVLKRVGREGQTLAWRNAATGQFESVC